ncbi:MAG: hypothetical protein K2P26_07620 [Oscillospiraceae bacterium]|nr:hypothetical protein [Oscillospiraceae bacterium]
MNYQDWYTDRMDIRRVVSAKDGALTVHKRELVAEDVPCRIYRAGAHGPRMQPTAAYTESEDKLACANSVDVRAGDELLIRRGGGLGERRPVIRAFAGDPVYYHEPFGAVMPGLAHQEIGLLQKEYVEGAAGEEDGNGAG